MVPSELTRQTTKFFSRDDVCHYELKPTGNDRSMYMNVTFNLILDSTVYLMYKEFGKTEHTIRKVESTGLAYEILRTDLDPADENLYVVTVGEEEIAKVRFRYSATYIPATVSDKSFLA